VLFAVVSVIQVSRRATGVRPAGEQGVAQIDDDLAPRRGEDRPGERRARRVDEAATALERGAEAPVIAVTVRARRDRAAAVAAVCAVRMLRVVPVVPGERVRARVHEADEADRLPGEADREVGEPVPAGHVDVAHRGVGERARQAQAVGEAEVRVLEDDDLAGEAGAPEDLLDGRVSTASTLLAGLPP
jgi:hypothetical protein